MRAIENIIQQIEGETRTGGNTKERVGAVLRLLKGKLEQFLTLFNGKLDKGNYEGTANDLANAIDRKVDKVSGKILSSNDFTNELRRKLEGLQQVDVSVLLPRGNFSGTAQDLKDLIDNLTRILQSPDTELDELREIVAYIKQNKHILSTLGISNIAGLEDALAKKADKDHNHDEVYAPKNHTHPDYAHREHQHNWDDILRKPNNLATTGNIKTAIDGIQVGGRNLLLKSGATVSDKQYEIAIYKITEDIDLGETVTLTIEGDFAEGCYPLLFASAGDGNLGVLQRGVNIWNNTAKRKISKGQFMYLYIIGNGNNDKLNTIRKIKLERGNKPTDWTPAPEDIRIATEISGERQVLPDDNIVYVTANASNCDLQLIPSGYSISFRKVFAGGQVTFTCTGKQIIYTGDTSFNGGDGSTAVVSIWNNKCYIDIRNI